jgi:acyl-coenzyme A synthetase/AMP-(fatty) acid ligase
MATFWVASSEGKRSYVERWGKAFVFNGDVLYLRRDGHVWLMGIPEAGGVAKSRKIAKQ